MRIWVIVFISIFGFYLMIGTSSAKTLSKEEVEATWEMLLRKEEYRIIEYLNRKYLKPTTDMLSNDKTIFVREGREGFLWGFFGLSEGGGWDIEGRLEAEVSIEKGILQLYSKKTIERSPGFMFPPIGAIEPRYDREKYPIWEFRLILRNLDNRQQIQTLKSIPVPATEVLQHLSYKFNQDDPSCPLGQRCPRGELHYDASRNVVVEILGIREPFNVEVPLPESSAPMQEEKQ
jgi:hypothetical protein